MIIRISYIYMYAYIYVCIYIYTYIYICVHIHRHHTDPRQNAYEAVSAPYSIWGSLRLVYFLEKSPIFAGRCCHMIAMTSTEGPIPCQLRVCVSTQPGTNLLGRLLQCCHRRRDDEVVMQSWPIDIIMPRPYDLLPRPNTQTNSRRDLLPRPTAKT